MRKILIIDDSEIMRLRLNELISSIGYQVVGEAQDGKEGLDKYKSLNPDIVTLDISMPLKNGIDTLKEIISINSNAQVIVISAMGQKAQIVEALRLGAKAYIIKPFEKEIVIEKLQSLE